LTGAAGLKPYTVIGAVRRLSGRLAEAPRAMAGHRNHEPTMRGGWSTRARVERVWARNEADAVQQVFGAAGTRHRDTAEATGTGRHRRDELVSRPVPVVPTTPPDSATGNDSSQHAEREWQRLDALPLNARAKFVADGAWQNAYTGAYPSAYAATATRIGAIATDAATSNPAAWPVLYTLASAASDAITMRSPVDPLVPPADVRTLTSAQAAAQAALHSRQSPAAAVADVAYTAGRAAGTLAGSLTAAADVLIGWRVRGGETFAADTTINGQQSRDWVTGVLAAVNREAARSIATHHVTPPAAQPTAVQLARQDQALDSGTAAPASPPATTGRHRASGTRPVPHTRTR
jgi:hypothetical protein